MDDYGSPRCAFRNVINAVYGGARGGGKTITKSYWLNKFKEVDMKNLIFENPTFHKGMNYTVRYTEWWGNNLSPGDYLDMMMEDRKRIGLVAWVKVVIRCKLKDVPKDVYANEHDRTCRTVGGLRNAMRKYYDDLKEISTVDLVEKEVTCIGFIVLGE